MLIPDDPDERQIYALRIVAQRCLYGVDKNSLAAEMAKLSLWLLTLAKDKPFEFLDHAIRCGDSMVGIHNLDQLRKFKLDGKGEDNGLFLQFLDPRIKEAIGLRRQLEAMQVNTVEDVQAQERMLLEANEKIERLKCAADLLIAAEFTPGSAADKRGARDDAAIKVSVHFHHSDLPTFRREVQKALKGQPTFHWPLEFPEVFVDRGGFDAFVGNPPFMGGTFISGRIGSEYRQYLVSHIAADRRGNADLSTYFLLRSASLTQAVGKSGFLTTNTIAQGDTRTVGLEHLLQTGFTIPRAISSRSWPGAATVYYSAVWLSRGPWLGQVSLDDVLTTAVTSFLSPKQAVHGDPHRLLANKSKSFLGTKVYGLGFVLSVEEAQALVKRNEQSRSILFPYLDGEDVNSNPDHSASRCVINFFDWPLEKAKEYPECFSIVEARVKPDRMQLRDNVDGKRRKEYWWQYGRLTPALDKAITDLERVLVISRITNYVQFAFVNPRQVFADRLTVFSIDDYGVFAVLSSTLHYVWSWMYSVTNLSLLSYSSTDCFETFPFPLDTGALAEIGRFVDSFRHEVMRKGGKGLTALYNRFHDPNETCADIQKLRELQVEMDNAVAAAYGWTDLDLGHDFHKTKQGIRYTISEAARREVLARLLKLNHERYDEEVRQGLHEKKGRGSKGKGQGKPDREQEGGLF